MKFENNQKYLESDQQIVKLKKLEEKKSNNHQEIKVPYLI